MPNGFTITNLPEAAEPSTLAEVTALVTAVGTAFSGVIVPLIVLAALWMFRQPISEVIRNLSSLEGPGGVKVQTHERLGPATEAVEELTAEEIAADPAAATPQGEEGSSTSSVPSPVTVPDNQIAAHPRQTDADQSADDDAGSVAEHHRGINDRLNAVEGEHQKWSLITTVDDQYGERRTFSDLLRVHPASAVLFTWNEVDAALRLLGSSRGLSAELLRGPARVLISRLKRLDAMPVELAELLREMMEVRSEALNHGAQITEKTALAFRRSAKAARKEIARQTHRSIQTEFRFPVYA